MQFAENFSLKELNTFGMDVKATFYYELNSKSELVDLLQAMQKNQKPVLFLGGGSNILFTKDFDGYVVRIVSKGIEIVESNECNCYVKVQAGEAWDSLIAFCLKQNLYGLENLTGIPGSVGSSPIQNIGAYGVEVKDCIHQVNFTRIEDGKDFELNVNECHFGYRDSIFKRELKGKVVITSVVFCLSKQAKFVLNYGGVADEVNSLSKDNVTLRTVSEAIVRIRNRKIPDPKVLGSAGSFFKNPIITKNAFDELIAKFPKMISYKISEQSYKIAAAWLIEQCGWKGYRKNDAGVSETQPLILVNFGNASGHHIFLLSQKVQQSVFKKFSIIIEPEVNIL
ncbi:MAG: UDP-N-acetylmuramate dehydrogenase [Bacteroidota bacterium]